MKTIKLSVLAVSLIVLLSCLVFAAPETKKVEVCHIPPGNPTNIHTIYIGENSVSAHLDHGDYVGRCSGEDDANTIPVENSTETIEPIVECVSSTEEGYTAFFGYENKNAKAVRLGNKNKLVPGKDNSEQPIVLKQGRQKNVFSIDFKWYGFSKWTINGQSATASILSTRCSSEAPVNETGNETANDENLVNLNRASNTSSQEVQEASISALDAAINYCKAILNRL